MSCDVNSVTHLLVAPRFDLNVAVKVALAVLLLALAVFGTLCSLGTGPARC